MARTRLTLRRIEEDGEHGVFDGDYQVGVISHKHLIEHAKASMREVAKVARPIPGVTLPVDEQVAEKAKEAMIQYGLSFGQALKKVFTSDRDLEERYRAAHRKEMI